MAEEIHVEDVGVQFEYQLIKSDGSALDVSGASLIQITYSRPGSNNLVVSGSLLNSGTDGWIKYITQVGDLSSSGKWNVQVYIEIGDYKFHSEIESFIVYPNL